MRARALFAATVGALLLAVAIPAAAKALIAEAHISGPGLGGGGLHISAPATEGMWDSGIDVAGSLDDTRPDSVMELGLTVVELGPRYVVTYRFDAGSTAAEIVRQGLHPSAKGGPATYTPPGQRIAEGLQWGGAISAGWYQSSLEFFHSWWTRDCPVPTPWSPPIASPPRGYRARRGADALGLDRPGAWRAGGSVGGGPTAASPPPRRGQGVPLRARSGPAVGRHA